MDYKIGKKEQTKTWTKLERKNKKHKIYTHLQYKQHRQSLTLFIDDENWKMFQAFFCTLKKRDSSPKWRVPTC
jgi:hypothetical protein